MIICSCDRHRKPGEVNPFYLQFLDYLMEARPKLWMQLGDQDEMAWFDFPSIYRDPVARAEIEKEREVAKLVETIRLPGNHDWDIAKYQEYLRPIIIAAPRFQIDGIQFSHWDEWDPISSHLWTPLTKNALIKRFLPTLYLLLYGTPGYVGFISKKRWEALAELFNEHFERYADANGVHVAGGHTHYRFVNQTVNGFWVGNAGSSGIGSWLEITEWGWRTRTITEV